MDEYPLVIGRLWVELARRRELFYQEFLRIRDSLPEDKREGTVEVFGMKQTPSPERFMWC